MDITEKKIRLEGTSPLLLCGYNDSNILLIENRVEVAITVRGDTVVLKGSPDIVRLTEKVIDELLYGIKRTGSLSQADVIATLDHVLYGREEELKTSDPSEPVVYYGVNSTIKARTNTQQKYVQKVKKHDVVFGIGPAGTGKTYLAVAMALAALKARQVQRIILSRPAVEAGESLGFLPGDLSDKIDPYLRPLLDAITDMVGNEKTRNMLEKRIVEIIPLAYMRGRTFNNSFIILDEAQNATAMQMKMFLTRLGQSSKTVITGDITQVDLHRNEQSGLIAVQKILKGIKGIDFVYFEKSDVVRHRLVADIIDAYEKKADQMKSDKE